MEVIPPKSRWARVSSCTSKPLVKLRRIATFDLGRIESPGALVTGGRLPIWSGPPKYKTRRKTGFVTAVTFHFPLMGGLLGHG